MENQVILSENKMFFPFFLSFGQFIPFFLKSAQTNEQHIPAFFQKLLILYLTIGKHRLFYGMS